MHLLAIDHAPIAATIALVDLDIDDATLKRYASWLDVAERERAARFRYDRDRNRFIARRGQLREPGQEGQDEDDLFHLGSPSRVRPCRLRA